jgi:hypothetical protein
MLGWFTIAALLLAAVTRPFTTDRSILEPRQMMLFIAETLVLIALMVALQHWIEGQ